MYIEMYAGHFCFKKKNINIFQILLKIKLSKKIFAQLGRSKKILTQNEIHVLDQKLFT